MTTKAAAQRWLAARVGQELITRQVRPSGMVWEPGARTLSREGNIFRLDGSRVTITRTDVVLACDDARLAIEWQDADGVTIHVTTYTPVQTQDEDEG